MTLLELAARCEAATGPDRELDVEIALAVGVIREREGNLCYATGNDSDYVLERGYYDLEGGLQELPYFTASLDAAMTLVPEGWRWVMREACPDKANPNERGFFARLETRDFESVTWGKGSDWITDVVTGQGVFSWAATPALALCAAALKARSASGIEAPSGVETGNTDSTEGESPTGEAGDAQGPSQ